MQPLSQQHARRMAYRILAFQIVVTGAVGALFFLFSGRQAGLSAVFGGAINVIGCYTQVRVAFAQRTGDDPKRAAGAFYLGEILKIAVIVTLFALALRTFPLTLLPMILAFVATLFVFLAALLMSPAGEKQG